MSKLIFCCWAILAISLVGFAIPARADTDYTCLNRCIVTGKPGPVCLPLCSYQPPRANSGNGLVTSIGSAAPNHRLLPVLNPLDQGTVVTQSKVPNVTATKDYKCIAQCLHANIRYEMCEESCIEVTTTNGKKLPNNQNDKLDGMLFKDNK